MIWSIWLAGKDSLIDIQTQWTLIEVLDALDALIVKEQVNE